MRGAGLFIFAVVLFSSCNDKGVEPFVESNVEFKGFSYTSFDTNGFAQGNSLQAIEDLYSQTSSKWIALCVFEFQTSPLSADIQPNISKKNPVTGNSWYATSTPGDIAAAVARARANGMKIMLKPHVDLNSGEWRGAILPDDNGKWFASYRTMILKYASLAESLHIEMLCIGTELLRATQPKFTPQWKALIADVRKKYSGKLTYSANWSGAFEIQQTEFQQIEFWNELDYIGTGAYVPLAEKNYSALPSYGDAMKRIEQWKSLLRSVSLKYGKKAIITELGCQSASGALAAPYDFSIGNSANISVDYSAQEFFYSCMISSFKNESFCAGMFWWNWESVISSIPEKNYTCKNKPAAVVVKNFYN